MKSPHPPSEDRRRRAEEILKRLDTLYPDAWCSLNYENPFQLLVATVLSAQCTDERVNKVTPTFFGHFPTPQAVAQAPVEDIEKLIHAAGLYRNKARNIQKACRILVDRHGGKRPGYSGRPCTASRRRPEERRRDPRQCLRRAGFARGHPRGPGFAPAGPDRRDRSPAHRTGSVRSLSQAILGPPLSSAHPTRPAGVPGSAAPVWRLRFAKSVRFLSGRSAILTAMAFPRIQ